MKTKAQISQRTLEQAQSALVSGKPKVVLDLLAKSPAVLPVLLLRGGALAALARYEEAATIFASVLRHDSRQTNALYNLALCQKALGRFPEAKGNLEKLLERQPGHISAALNLNGILAALNCPKEQENLLTRSLALSPDEPRLRRSLAVLHYQRQRYDEALELAEALATADPPDPASLDLLGLIQLALGKKQNAEYRIDRAASLFEQAAKLAPDILDYRLHYGGALSAREETAGAAQSYFQQLAEHYPENARVHFGLGQALLRQGRLQEARLSLEKAVAYDPNDAAAQHRLSLVALTLGDYETGSRTQFWRWRIKEPPTWRAHDLPIWDGSRLTAGRLLVWSEQGLGDELLTYSWLPHLSELGISFGVECDSRLVGLLQRAFPEAEILSKNGPVLGDLSTSGYTAHCPCYDLLTWTRPWKSERRRAPSFLKSDQDRRQEFRRRISELGEGAKIGLSWFSKGSLMAFGKSLPLMDWEPILAERQALFVNLQYGDSEAEFDAACRATGVKGYCDPDLDRMNDIEGLCALIDSLDLVITVSNVTAHFAGALGKPCWLLLGTESLWHWGGRGETTPFYPSLTAFRAAELGGWKGVAAHAAQRLSDHFRN